MDNLPTVSIIIPIYNSERTLRECLEAIRMQDYPEEKLEVIIADAGSTDSSLDIARSYKVDKVVHNALKTGEAGKAAGLREAKNDIIALIDSDNVMESRDWLKRMVEPFQDIEIVASEPLNYTYRKTDGFITRYCALIGMNDPLCVFLGNYDRYSSLTGRWTESPVKICDKGGYLKVILIDEKRLPTIGANGFLVRREDLLKCHIKDYLFDIDVVYDLLKQGRDKFAKVKIGIVHIFSGDIRAFIRKQRRRVKDYLYFSKVQNLRRYPWGSVNKKRLIKFIVYSSLVLPVIFQAVRGYVRQPDMAWFFHPAACVITLWVYSLGMLTSLFRSSPMDRDGWQKR